MVRVAVLNRDRCKFKDCHRECYKYCPQVRIGYTTIAFGEDGYPIITESLCTGCGICVKKCPFKAISIVNLPEELEGGLIHQFGVNTFRLYRLPVPKKSKVSGLVGANGVGKSTAMNILAGKIKPNLGKYDNPPDWDEIIDYFSGSELQGYFKKMADGKLKAVHKPQHITNIPKVVKGTVKSLLEKVDERGISDELKEILSLKSIWNRDISHLSGGELQKVAIAAVIERDADVYLFDEPSSYLDVRERVNVARVIHDLTKYDKTVVIIEHDLAVLDYLSDYVSILYGKPSVYGIVSNPYVVRTGINVYLDGYIPDENVRFRDEGIKFDSTPFADKQWQAEDKLLEYPSLVKTLDGFKLITEAGTIYKGEIIGILGPNGIGKTTFVKLLANIIPPDTGAVELGSMRVAYKPQYLKADFEGTVRLFLRKVLGPDADASVFKSSVLRPLGVEPLLDLEVQKLSGGELQRVAIAATIGRDADLYLFDEPSAFLDIEERLAMLKVIRRSVKSKGAAAFIVEHDIVVQDGLSDRLVIFKGQPGKEGHALAPMSLREGMNLFLKEINITFRRDPHTGRPRVNKEGSRLDRQQKSIGEYYYVPLKEDKEEK
ncbi:MAG: ribosome biogenesis/translation initiation ATPase RLI [Candidatus Odinarchaeota archaeon]|nr:ribosome biogenesis/translation initiation ATPase RLI [Candidatus Odinarchaeota archaeon]